MPSFQASCESCGKVATFAEGRRERRKADFTTEVLFYFECGACGARIDRLLDTAGVLHKWNGAKHASYKPGT